MSKTFLATTGQGLARALETDGQWSVQFSKPDTEVLCLAADPQTANGVYAGTRGDGVQCSRDGGQTWGVAGLAGHVVKALAVSPIIPGLLYAGTKPPALFVSRDSGQTWDELTAFQKIRAWWWRSPAEADLGAYIQAIALSPTDPNNIVIGIEAGAVLRTTDGGATWAGHRPGALRDCHTLTFHAANGDWVYEAGGTGAGASFSRDAGRTWTQPRAGLDRPYGWACAADPARPDVWYISASPIRASWSQPIPAAHVDGKANAYIFRSLNGGAWEKLDGGLPQPLTHMAYALLTDPAAPGHLYAGLSNGEVWHSTNYGDAWTQLSFNLQSIHRTLVMF